jgi:hypothetical protein
MFCWLANLRHRAKLPAMPRIGLIMILLLPVAAIAAPDFNGDVLPIFSDNCFKCHGPDANARKAKLRLEIALIRAEKIRPPNTPATVVLPGDKDLAMFVAFSCRAFLEKLER